MKIRFFEHLGTHYGVAVPDKVKLGAALSPAWRGLKKFNEVDPLVMGSWVWKADYIKLWSDLKRDHGLTPLKLDLEMKARGVSLKWRQRSGLDFFLGLNE